MYAPHTYFNRIENLKGARGFVNEIDVGMMLITVGVGGAPDATLFPDVLWAEPIESSRTRVAGRTRPGRLCLARLAFQNSRGLLDLKLLRRLAPRFGGSVQWIREWVRDMDERLTDRWKAFRTKPWHVVDVLEQNGRSPVARHR